MSVEILCADFMERSRMLLEADRRKLYADMPVADHWHENYAAGRADTQPYLRQARALYPDFRLE